MGYCTYVPYASGRGKGAVVATWIGTGTDQGCSRSVVYNKSARLSACIKSPCHTSTNCPACNADKSLKCKDVRNQFIAMIKSGKDQRGNPLKCKSSGYNASKKLTHELDIVGQIVNFMQGRSGNETVGDRDKVSGSTPNNKPDPKSDPSSQYCKDVCKKACGLNPLCHYAKSECQCGGDVSGIFGEIPNLCKDLPPPFNNCIHIGIFVIVAFGVIWMLK